MKTLHVHILSLSFFLVTSGITSLPASSQPPAIKTLVAFTPLELERFLSSKSIVDTPSAKLFLDQSIRRIEPVMVFIPGMFGSKLTDTSSTSDDPRDQVVWGCIGNALFSDERLNFDTNPDLLATPLLGPNSPIDDCAFHVYEDFFLVMTNSLLAKEQKFLNFAYDWRQDIDTSALHLHQFLRDHEGVLAGNNVVFVAHSMGGLVLKSWYHDYYQSEEQESTFTISKIYFVGTPHGGSYAAVGALKNGHTLLSKAGTFLGWLESQIIRPLNSYGLTFPSFYHLLPMETDREYRSMYMPSVGQAGRVFRIDLYNTEAWQRLGFPNIGRVDLPPGVNSLEEFYSENLPRYLEKAKTFHERMHGMPVIPNSRYVYSFQHKTPNGLIARDRRGSPNLESEIVEYENGGDGIVFADSAKDSAHFIEPDHMIRLNEEHAKLIVDENFVDILLELKSASSTKWKYEAAVKWQDNEGIVQLFANYGNRLCTWLRLREFATRC